MAQAVVPAPDWLALRPWACGGNIKQGRPTCPQPETFCYCWLRSFPLHWHRPPCLATVAALDQLLYCSHRPVRHRISPLIILRMNAETGIGTGETAIGLGDRDQHSGPPYMLCWVHPEVSGIPTWMPIDTVGLGRKHLASTVQPRSVQPIVCSVNNGLSDELCLPWSSGAKPNGQRGPVVPCIRT